MIRRRKSGNEERMVKVTIAVHPEILNRLDALGQRLGLRRGEMIRTAITEYIERLEQYYRIRKEMGRLIETLRGLEDEDLMDLYANLTKEVRRRGLI